ncbi:MAG: MFS transporter [Cyanobacteria bacterium J06614_10]
MSEQSDDKATAIASMQTFLIVWAGQFASRAGSRMTHFSLTLWAWDITQQATALALVGFFIQVPRLLITPFAGIVVDRWNRKQLMMVGDTVAGVSTLTMLWLYRSGELEIWHLYGVGAVNGAFDQIQQLAYTTSMTMMVPKRHYSRAISLNFLSGYGSSILGPVIAGVLYPLVSLSGIFWVDLCTFAIAMLTVLWVTVPQPRAAEVSALWYEDLSVGFHFLSQRPGMMSILIVAALFQFTNEMTNAIHAPMILARSARSARALAILSATAGCGGIAGAILMSVWSGPRPRIKGVLFGMMISGFSKIGLSLSNRLGLWMPMQFCSAFSFPMMGSSGNAIWFSKVPPEIQGRVFSISLFIKGFVAPLGRLLVGPLADQVFEPAMMPNGSLVPIFGRFFGSGKGAGIATLYGLCAVLVAIIGFGGCCYRPLKTVEASLPDYTATTDMSG